MTPNYMSVCVKLLLKLTVVFMSVLSTSNTTQCATKETERDISVIRNVGIKLCQLKCVENGQCLSIGYNSDTLTCRLSRLEPQTMKKMDGFLILPRDHSHVPTGSCTSSMCSFGQRCLKTRSGKSVCVQDEKQNYPDKSPHRTVARQETFASNQLHEACRNGDLDRVRLILSEGSVAINSRDEKHGRTPLMLAAKEGHCRIFALLINKGANTSEVDNDGKNSLHWACKGGHVGMVECVVSQNGIVENGDVPPLLQAAGRGDTDVAEFLLCTGSNVSQVDRYNRNALHYAAIGGHMAMVKYLVSQGGVDINSEGKYGRTPVMEAALKGRRELFDFLVKKGANVSCVDDSGNNVLHLAVVRQKRAMVQYLVSQDIVDIDGTCHFGLTPLLIAATRGYTGIFRFLESKGADVSHVDDFGNNVVHLAMTCQQRAMVQYLVSQDIVDIDSTGNFGLTPLLIAARSGYIDIFRFLESKGANVSCVDDSGNNVLHLAVVSQQRAMVQYLVSQDIVDIDSTGNLGLTPLLIAARSGYIDIFRFLESKGANVSREDGTGNNVLHLASGYGRMEMVQYLVSRSTVDINSRRKDGRTPLMEAVLRGKRKVFDFLVKKGADVSHVDNRRNNILSLASWFGRMEMVKHILSKNLVGINARNKNGETAAMTAKRARKHSVYKLLVSKGCSVK